MVVNIKWSDKAKNELQITFDYLAENWTDIEIRKLATKNRVHITNHNKISSFFSNFKIQFSKKSCGSKI
jgi:hypothetical protein